MMCYCYMLPFDYDHHICYLSVKEVYILYLKQILFYNLKEYYKMMYI